MVFVMASDPVGQGLVASLARPGGNVTGVSHVSRYAMAASGWSLLKATRTRHRCVSPSCVNPTTSRRSRKSRCAQSRRRRRARRAGDCTFSVRDTADIERRVRSFARQANGGAVIVHSDALLSVIAAQALPIWRPAIACRQSSRYARVRRSWRPNELRRQHCPDCMRQAAGLRRSRSSRARRPAICQFEQPTKFELVINLKTAKALGLDLAAIAARRSPTR